MQIPLTLSHNVRPDWASVLLGQASDKPVASISRRNSKLGDIRSWSIPAVFTCPSRTAICEELCYACGGFFVMDSVWRGLWRNYRWSLSHRFVRWMTARLYADDVDVFRIHVAGDFYSQEYLYKWLLIAHASPATRFFLFTRTWRQRDYHPLLAELAELPNVQLWLSCDRDSGEPDLYHPRTRSAYMLTDGERAAAYPVDLYFRDHGHATGQVIKRIDGSLVCAQEQGTHPRANKRGRITNCRKCGICFADPTLEPARQTVRRLTTLSA